MAESGATPTDGSATPSTTPSGGRPAGEFRDIADALRSRVDLFGKALAAVATLGATAVGLSEIGDLFPADGNEEWVVAACLGLLVAALAAIGVAVRLMLVARPVFMSADLSGNKDLDEGEREVAKPVLDASAKRFGYESLQGLEFHEYSVRDAAAQTDDKNERARRTALADEVKNEIEQALARSQVAVVRRRSTRAVSSPLTWFLYFLVAAGLLSFAVGTDKVSSDREDLVAVAKACGEARKAGASDGELGRTDGACDGEASKPKAESPPSAAEARAQVAVSLAESLAACTALVKVAGDETSGPLKGKDCNPLREALSAVISP